MPFVTNWDKAFVDVVDEQCHCCCIETVGFAKGVVTSLPINLLHVFLFYDHLSPCFFLSWSGDIDCVIIYNLY
ncbi:hypothetical protein VNO80_24998 [Phaseolus coccineus]|uniref:Uncharacterized protein n=1 Tax=Phaseolus coccineus TaxID=3886 RepID=A0AAN9LUG5_PHACN